MALWKASDLKVREFCARDGVTPTAFAHWRKEIADRRFRGHISRLLQTGRDQHRYESATGPVASRRPTE